MGDGTLTGPPRERRIRRWVAAVLLLATTAAAVALGVRAWQTLPQTSGKAAVPGIVHPVEIWRDAHGVPHIFANSLSDAWFALGYAHAQDRMWQMEFTRRLGAGRLAEVFGRPALDGDRFFRTLGLYRLAEAQSKSLSSQARIALEAYANGVNAWLDHRAAALPIEFFLFGHEPEPWRIADSLVWERLLAYQLSTNWTTELLRARLALKLPKSLLVELWPADPTDWPVTIEGSGQAAAANQLIRRLGSVPAWLEARGASNAWVIGPGRSASGKPILANDTHLGLAAPNPWYLARLVTPNLEIAGATAPGAPFLLLGHNGSVAWGMTSSGADTQDLFIEIVDAADPGRYLTPGGPESFDIRHESILVKGSDAAQLTIRSTRHGPVISDFLADMDAVAGMNAVVALASTSEAPQDRTSEALADMATARNADEFAAAARGFESPALNIVFADTGGTIGMISPGRVPVRRRGDGSLPAAGVDGRQDWVGVIPPDKRPMLVNPATGFIMNANNRLVDDTYPWLIARDWAEPYRARRIEAYLLERSRYSLADMQALQTDILSDAARDLLPLMLDEIGRMNGDAGRAANMLRRWDRRMQRNSPEPLIYAAWLGEAMRGIAADELGQQFEQYWRHRPRFVRAVLTENRHWCGDARSKSPGNCGRVLSAALDRAVTHIRSRLGRDMAGWRWGDLHRARLQNRVLGEVPLLSLLAGLSIATDGGDHTVNVGALAPGGSDEPYSHTHGAVYRAIYDLSDLAESRYMIPGGQSGNPFSRHYRSLLEPWRDGAYLQIAGAREQLADAGYEHLVLTPTGR